MACQEFRKDAEKYDTVYPEPLSRLHRGPISALAVEVHPSNFRRNQRKALHRESPGNVGRGRYRTQPVTFDEIKEVDEEVNEDAGQESAATGAQSEEDLMQQKFQKLRLRHKGNRQVRRGVLRPSTSQEEPDGCDDAPAPAFLMPSKHEFISSAQGSSHCDDKSPRPSP